MGAVLCNRSGDPDNADLACFSSILCFAYTYGKWPSADLRIIAVSPALEFFQQTLELRLVWLAAGLHGGTRSAVLALNRASGGAQTYIVLACLVTLIMMPIVFFFNSFGVHHIRPLGACACQL